MHPWSPGNGSIGALASTSELCTGHDHRLGECPKGPAEMPALAGWGHAPVGACPQPVGPGRPGRTGWGPVTHRPGEPHPGALPGMGSRPRHACSRLWPAAKPCTNMYLHVTRPPGCLSLWVAAGRPSGMACNPPPRGASPRCPTRNGLPASPRMHPAVACRQTMPRHVSTCYTSARVLGVVGSSR